MIYKNGINEEGHPYSYENDFDLFGQLTEEQQTKCKEWVMAFCVPAKTLYRYGTSYGLKHILEACTGVYMTNNQFKDLMLIMGFYPANKNEQNWEFNIKKGPLKLASRFAECRRRGRVIGW